VGQDTWHAAKSEEVHTRFWWGKLMERRNLEDLGLDGRIILNKYSINRMNLSGSLCRGVVGTCEHGNERQDSVKCPEILD